MKKFTVLLLMITASFHFTTAQTGWVQQNSGTFFTLNSVCFVDANTGYAVGDSSYSSNIILKTSDGGVNWVIQMRQISNASPLTSVFFINTTTGFASGSGNFSNMYSGHVLYKTTNGGLNWTPNNYSDQITIFSIYFINSLTGFQIGFKFIVKTYVVPCILRTTDGGVNWNPQYPSNPPVGSLESICFPDSLNGFVYGDGYINKTTNSGMTWSGTNSPSTAHSIYFINSLNGWASGNSFVYKTTTGGNNWNSFSASGSLYSVRFTNELTGWASGSGGTIYGTTNGGINWALQSSGTTTNLISLSFINDQTGWVVGTLGKILRTTTGGLTFLEPISTEIANHFSLSQNYPNPFNPSTKIRFSIPISNKGLQPLVVLKVFDALGREVHTIINEQLKAGSYEADWNAANYPSGVYFYKLTAGDYIETRKMVLIK